MSQQRADTTIISACHGAMISHPVRRVALLLVCTPYLLSGIHKLMDFDAGIAEMSRNGLLPAAPYAAATILLQLGCCAMILTGFCRWLGALVLAAFTLAASVIANAFWQTTPQMYETMRADFADHLALVGGLLLIAWYGLHKYKNRGEDDWK
ncbi:putative membrane protein YphA (DoxX/SURF4 family) [Pararhizobium capsulatum DSM 1112]|uniref:Membrane protein YphA (DoxX/SURF4 family) n=1 Tax=Pararhizobium capsulatum DSM 1112 TaxID=1121113 RepID=A0ABU0BXK2_9HYPH|nr:DoxX family protein [Pararhizobium capsulatum]MDQ0322371.1 putative membrane protein YphA (DoxX/SURF4 family) [Pararhizobium capsulatum DSM 1112]